MQKKLKLIFGFLVFIVFCSCEKKSGINELQLPSDTAISDANKYALIVDIYISIYDKPSDTGISIAHARKREIFLVEGIEIEQKDNSQILWVGLCGGWVPSSSVQLYATREKALNASKRLK